MNFGQVTKSCIRPIAFNNHALLCSIDIYHVVISNLTRHVLVFDLIALGRFAKHWMRCALLF